MSVSTDRPVEEMSHEELSTEYSDIGDVLFFGGLPSDDEQDALYDRRMELWQEMKTRVDVELPECPRCGNTKWSQTPGDPKECGSCGFEPQQTELIEKIDDAWQTILNEN